MKSLHHSNLSVTMIPPATNYGPVDYRKYTLMKEIGNEAMNYLAIGYQNNANIVNNEVVEVLTAHWTRQLGEYVLRGKINIGGTKDHIEAAKESFINIKADLANMIAMLINGDRELYKHVPWLKDAPIYIEFASPFSKFRSIQYCGTPRNYFHHMIEKHR